jgi:hypothetical protein
MSARCHKIIRRVAQLATVGQPARRLIVGHRVNKRTPAGLDAHGLPKYEVVTKECFVNAPGTTRRMVRDLKHEYRRYGHRHVGLTMARMLTTIAKEREARRQTSNT